MVIAVAMILGMFHLLIIAKFFPLFAHYGNRQWDVFMRNFHMSGFDPTGYAVLTHWHQGYDVVRHPLLALMMLPFYGLNRLLWWITGCNCCQIVMGALLLMAGITAWLMLFRTLNEHLALPPVAMPCCSLPLPSALPTCCWPPLCPTISDCRSRFSPPYYI